jgi:hypothetical protein
LVLAGLIVLLACWLAQHHILTTADRSWISAYPQPTSTISFVGVPLDDVYIHCRYAQNLLAGQGYCFNPGEAVSADTSPLWVLLIALGGLFNSELEVVAVLLSAFFYLVLAVGVYRVAKELLILDEGWALLAGVVTLLSGRLIWSGMSGMEPALAALFALLIAEEHARQVPRGSFRAREAAYYALGFLARPELLVIAAFCLAHWIYLRWRDPKIDLSRLALGLSLATVFIAPYVGFNLLTRVSIFPHSASVQGAGSAADPLYLIFGLKALAANNVLLLLAAAVALWKFRQKEWLPAILFLALLIPLQAFFAPQSRHHGRYFFPILPLLTLFGVYGMSLLSRRYVRFTSVIAACAVLISAAEGYRWIGITAHGVRNIHDQQVMSAQWVKQNVKPEDRLALHDVGAIAYMSDRPVIDLVGLVSPKIHPLLSDQAKVWGEARAQGANVFVIFNRMNPTFYETFRDSLELMAEFRIRKPIVSSADTVMSAYRLKQ